ncbi:MAG: 6-carboxytetrahydropterin synthase [Holophagae bacterium]|nr:6-carboxytetrahydropterin synthase [Holophagae bacterium]
MKELMKNSLRFQYLHILESFFVASHKHYGEILHGHNFRCRLKAELDRPEFNRVCFRQVMRSLDYQHLNRLPYFRRFTPSTENIAQYIAESMASLGCKVKEVEVFETEGFSGGVRICGS